MALLALWGASAVNELAAQTPGRPISVVSALFFSAGLPAFIILLVMQIFIVVVEYHGFSPGGGGGTVCFAADKSRQSKRLTTMLYVTGETAMGRIRSRPDFLIYSIHRLPKWRAMHVNRGTTLQSDRRRTRDSPILTQE